MSRVLAVALFALILAGCTQNHLQASGLKTSGHGDPGAPVLSGQAVDSPTAWSPSRALVDPEAELLFSLLAAELAAQMGAYEQASDYYLSAARLSQDPAVAERATRLALFAHHHPRALAAAERWLALDSDSLEALQIAAVLMTGGARSQQASILLQQLIERLGAEEGYRTVVALLVQAEDSGAALDALEAVVEARSDEATGWQAYAELALRLEYFVRARTVARAGIERFPDAVALRITLARALIELEDSDAARETLAAAVEAHPERRDVRLAYARALVDVEDFERVRPEFDRLLALAPDDAELLLTTALLSLEAGQFGLAQGYLERLLASGRRIHDAHYYLGRLHEQAGDLQAAKRAYEALGEGEHADDASLRQARLAAEIDGPEAGRAHFAALQEDGDEELVLRAYLAEANMLREMEELEQALGRLAHGLIQFPGDRDLLYLRGLVYERAGNTVAAKADFRAILAADPDNVAALNALGYTLADRTDRYEEAHELILRAYAQRPDDAAIIDSYGWVLYRLGRLDEALVKLREAYALLPDGEIASNLAVVLWALGEREESRAILDAALEREPDHQRLLRVHRDLGQ